MAGAIGAPMRFLSGALEIVALASAQALIAAPHATAARQLYGARPRTPTNRRSRWPPLQPQSKGRVSSAVQMAARWMFARLCYQRLATYSWTGESRQRIGCDCPIKAGRGHKTIFFQCINFKSNRNGKCYVSIETESIDVTTDMKRLGRRLFRVKPLGPCTCPEPRVAFAGGFCYKCIRPP